MGLNAVYSSKKIKNVLKQGSENILYVLYQSIDKIFTT